MFIVRTFFNNSITVAVCTGFHVGLMGMLTPAAEAGKMKSPSRSHGGQEAGASIFGTTTQQNRATLEPSRYSDYG